MKIKVAFFSRILWKRYLLFVSGISVFASLFFVAVNVPDEYKVLVFIGIALALFTGYVILWILANKTTSKKLNINGSPLEVKIGDIFEEGELRVINFNEYFDTVVDDKLIAKLAKLSSLEIDDSRKEKLKTELADIINFVENLSEIDVSNIEATFSPIEGGTPLREDVTNQDLELSKHILKHAPKSEDGYFIVPKIIE